MRNIGLRHAVIKSGPFLKRFRDLFHSVKTIDNVMIFIAILYPFTVVPQIMKIYMTQNADSISLLSLILKAAFAIPWVYYGLIHKSKPVIFTNVLWFVAYIVLIIQVFVY